MTAASTLKANKIPEEKHSVSQDNISPNAIKVLTTLHTAGHEAYLVGGSVRDLLLGHKPKDFDIATSAHPEEIKALFRNSRLIGRRFKLAHILFGREIIEVATFRSTPTESSSTRKDNQTHSQKGQILCDNQYGSVEEDAIRRDFTINAMYYELHSRCIHDFANGIEDISKKQLQLIGKPEERYREDPVRMLRAVRFASKLDFVIAQESAEPIARLAPLLENIPGARLFDECQKLFSGGQAVQTFQLLQDFNLLTYLFPATAHYLNDDSEPESKTEFSILINYFLENTDDRISQGKSTTLAFLIAVFFWQPFKQTLKRLQDDGTPLFPAIHQAAQVTLSNHNNPITIPRRFAFSARDIWELQFRLPQRHGKRAAQLIQHPRFRAGYDFLLLREKSGEITPGVGQWWTEYQDTNEEGQLKMAQELKPAPRHRKKKSPGKKNKRT